MREVERKRVVMFDLTTHVSMLLLFVSTCFKEWINSSKHLYRFFYFVFIQGREQRKERELNKISYHVVIYVI